MSTDESFLTVSNIRNLLHIFDKFLRDRYSLEYDPNTFNIKEIMYETMMKVNSENQNSHLSLVQLNKMTLSIVKTITKKKLLLDRRFNRSLTRDRDVLQSNSMNTIFNRPVQSTTEQSKQSIMDDFDSLRKNRESEQTVPSVPKSMEGGFVDSISENDFLKKLEILKGARDTNTIPMPSSETIPDFLSDPKEFFASKQPMNFPANEENLAFVPNESVPLQTSENIGAVIPPLKQPPVNELRTAYIVIDSRNRPNADTTKPCEYIIEFDSPIKNIASIELTYALYDSSP
jgi:hypothetical protein